MLAYLSTAPRRLALASLCLALPLLAAPAYAPYAQVSPTTINPLTYFADLTAAEQDALLDRYTTLAAAIKADKARAAAMRTALDATPVTPINGVTPTEADYTTLLGRITENEADAETLRTWITTPAPSRDDVTAGGGEEGGSGGGENPLGGIVNSLVSQMMGGGGNFGGLSGIAGMADGSGMQAGNLGYAGAEETTASRKPEQPKDKEEKKDEKKNDGCTPRGSTESNPGKLKDDTVSSGSQTADNPGKAQDDGSAAAQPAAEECKGADVNTPNPTGSGAKPDKITSLEDAQKYVGQFVCDPSTSNCDENGQQCASLTKAIAPEVGRASTWRKGDPVKGNDIPIGTPIATFNYGNSYCQVSNGKCGIPGGGVTHTGIYLGQNSTGIIMLQQYTGQPAVISVRPWNGNGISGNKYYTIAGSSALHEYIPLLQPVWLALGLVPFDGGLSNG